MDTEGTDRAERRAGNRLGWTLLAVAVLFAVVPPLLRHTDDTTPPTVRVSTRPVSAEFKHFYELTIRETTPAYVVAAGQVRTHEWFIVGYADRKGRPCFAIHGYFGTSHGGCPTNVDAAAPVHFLGGSGDARGSFLEYGLAGPQVRTVVFLTDTGQSWATPAVAAGSSKFRYFAALDPRGGMGGIAERAWKGSDGVLHRAPDTPVVVPPLCAKSESPLQGIADGLPMAGETKFPHADAVVHTSTATLIERFGATDVRVEPRNGQVWMPPRESPKVVEAADALIRLYLPSAARCPTEPQSFEGIPLSFAIGPAPALPEVAKVYPSSSPLPTQQPDGSLGK